MNEKFRSVISHSSDDKVKVVYSWHGPRGPLWNTELPNILTFASSAEGVNPMMESRSFWNDDIWQKQFSKAKDKYEMYAVQTIEADDRRPFIYPFSLTWRVEFEKYFINTNGLLEFSHMPDWLLHLVVTSNGYILIDHSVEAFMSDRELSAMFSYFHEHHQIPMYKIIYLTGTINASKVYEEWHTKNNIPQGREHRMHVIPYASSREIFHMFYNNPGTGLLSYTPVTEPKYIPSYDENEVPEKLFLSWNRRYRKHRVLLVLALEQLDLVDKSLISFQKIDGENGHDTFMNQVTNIQTDDQDFVGRLNLYGNTPFEFDDAVVIPRFANKLPLVIDGETDINKMCEDWGHTAQYYKQTLVSLVTETNYNTKECTLTEKSFKPMYNKHPFMIVGVPGTIRGLQDLGFKTFSEFWDESYDDESQPGLRMEKILNNVKLIASWTPDQVLDFKRRVKPILEHNYNMFSEPGSVAVVNNIYNHITDNFEPVWTNGCHPGKCYFEGARRNDQP